ncbi:MAG TPA: SGNH/GDSL hydrolase family protein [Solirubrobacterales bacterium]
MARPLSGRTFLHAALLVSVLLALGSVFSHESSAAEWEELPVVPVLGPAVTSHLEKVAGRGEIAGNQPGVFVKIGDSITASPSFLQALACRSPRLGAWHGLRGTLEFFGQTPVPAGSEEALCAVSNSYSRLGVAAVGGWRAADALLPRESFPECQGLPAVSCELQLLRPSVALIMFGTNDLEDFTAVEFRRDLARVARLVSGAGTIPVISTIPPRARWPFSQRVARFNAEIAALAENRALPLWNYWREMVGPGVPGEGLSRDGVHPSVLCPPCTAVDFRPVGLRQGYALRNLGALRVLDRLRRRVPLGDGL